MCTAVPALLAAVMIVPATAHAATATLADARLRVAVLDQQIAEARSTVAFRRSAAAAGTLRLMRASDRLARALSRAPAGPVLPWQFPTARRRDRHLRALRQALITAQDEVRRSGAMPRLLQAESQLAHLRALRSSAAAVERAILQAAVANTTATEGTTATTRGAWARSLLQAIGAPACGDNLEALVAWQTAENTTAAWNPLATTYSTGSSTTFNSAGVAGYPTMAEGLSATVQTLRDGYDTQGYGWILYRLGQCAPASVTATAINRSNWCYRCAGGRYVVDILPLVDAEFARYAALTG